MKENRYYHGCGLIRNNGDVFEYNLVVLGGVSNAQSQTVLKSTEIFDANTLTWITGPDFPTAIHGMSMAQYSSDTILCIGGSSVFGGNASNKVYSLSKTNMAQWVFLGGLSGSRFAQISLLVPKSFLHCRGDPNEDEIPQTLILE